MEHQPTNNFERLRELPTEDLSNFLTNVILEIENLEQYATAILDEFGRRGYEA